MIASSVSALRSTEYQLKPAATAVRPTKLPGEIPLGNDETVSVLSARPSHPNTDALKAAETAEWSATSLSIKHNTSPAPAKNSPLVARPHPTRAPAPGRVTSPRPTVAPQMYPVRSNKRAERRLSAPGPPHNMAWK
ncbi:hypothetical protein EJ06DRAFT_275615 [Trichodelitschia bisporula]|uniref:Uncharacterized protein n=1 Tax=Trichodelitschia bisporula TaxID=703511 RepID=A0A6G1I5R0_9PEZI|nr:hypothetical protein EJ06DRAFT_275615 [Trichodelitschia bisporula]